MASKLASTTKFIARSTLSLLNATKSACVWTIKHLPRKGHVLSLPPDLMRDCRSSIPVSTTTLVRSLSEQINSESRAPFLEVSTALRFAINNKLIPLRTELQRLEEDSSEDSDKIFLLMKFLDETIRQASFGEIKGKDLPNLLSGYDKNHGLEVKFYASDYVLLRVWISSLGGRVITAYKLRGNNPLIIRFYRDVTAIHKLLPSGRICFSARDKLIFYPTLCVSLISASALIYYWPQAALGLSVVTLTNLVLALTIRLLYSRRRLRFLSSLVAIQHQLALSSQQPFLSNLVSLAEQEMFKQCLLTFYLLQTYPSGLTKAEIDAKGQEKFSSDISFNSAKSLSLLSSFGLVNTNNGVYKAIALNNALSCLPSVPVNFFPDEVDWLEADEKHKKFETYNFWR